MSAVAHKKITARTLVKFVLALVFAATLTGVSALTVLADEVRIISGFSGEDTVSWMPGDNVVSVGLSEFSWEQDGHSYKRSCLEVTGKYAPRDTLRAAVAEFDEPLDLTEYLAMSFDIYAPLLAGDPDAIFLARLTLVSASGESTEHLQMIDGGKWNHIEANIGSWDARGSIVSAEIAVAIDTSLGTYSSERFYVDDISVSDPVDRDMTERYLFDAYTVEGGVATLAGDKSKISIVSDTEGILSLEAAVFPPELDYSLNCLRIRLANYTDSDTLTVHYSTSDSQVTTEDKIVTVPIEPNSDVRDYFVFVGDAAQLKSVALIFNSAVGQIDIISINAISAYEASEYDTCGKLTSCTLNADLSVVTFSGEIGRETASANRNGYIAIFAHDTNELPSAHELSQMTPLVKTQMTTRFELYWNLPKDGKYDISTRFIAVSVGEGGEYRLICPPFHVQNLDRVAEKSAMLTPDAKGFASNDISIVSDVGATLTLLELDIEKLLVAKSKADSYIYRGEAYYFDGEYLDALNAKLNVLRADGIEVLLRLHGWKNSDAERLDAFYAEDKYVDYTKSVRYNDGGDYIAAIGSYIAEKWAADEKIVGVIFGEGENIFAGQDSLSEMVRHTARDLRTLYFALAKVNSNIKLYVSLTDMYTAYVNPDDGEIGLDVYLPALIKETAKYGQFPWEAALESVYRVGTQTCEFVSAEEHSAVSELLASNGAADKHLVFIDHTYFAFASRKADNVTNFVLGTYASLFNDGVDAYIAAVGSRADEVADSVRYIYTDEAYTVESVVREALGISDFSEVIAGFDADKLPKKSITATAASTSAPTNTRGTFNYYRFDGVSDIGGLSPSYYSYELRIANDGGNVLSVALDRSRFGYASSAAWLGIGHNFDVGEDLRLTPTVAFSLKVDEVAPASLTVVAVKIILNGENERFEATAEIPVGEWTTLYVDTSDFTQAKDTRGLRIFVDGGAVSSATLKIKSIDGHSSEYEDESLAKVIESTRQKRINPDAAVDYSAYLPVALGALVVVATVIVVVLLRKRHDKDSE